MAFGPPRNATALPELSPRYISIRTRKQRRPVSLHKELRQLWMSEVKHWCRDATEDVELRFITKSPRFGLLDAETQLSRLAQHRHKLLEDVQDPRKRSNFTSADNFNQAYGTKIGKVEPAKQHEPYVAPHPMSVLPALGPLSPRTPMPPPQPKPASTRTRAPSSRMAPAPERIGAPDEEAEEERSFAAAAAPPPPPVVLGASAAAAALPEWA